jgi:hypothetical protein
MAAPRSAYSHVEEVRMTTLDEDLKDVRAAHCWLKIDTQGAEHLVLAGAHDVLRRTEVVQCELSLRPLYEGGARWMDVVRSLDVVGFQLIGVEPGMQDCHGLVLLQFDGLFARTNALP